MSCQRLRHQFQFENCPSKARAALPRRHYSRRSIEARTRSTRRATDEIEPRDPFQKHTARRSGGGSQSGSGSPPPNYQQDFTSFNAFKRAKEPFEAELLILFGLPTLIILIPWAVKEPAALAVIPIAFLVPGVRDVLLAVLRSTFLGVRRAKKFMKEDDGNYYNGRDRYDRRSATGAATTKSWSAPPPPPPPPGSGGSYYDLSQDDFTVGPGSEKAGIEDEEGDREESVARMEEQQQQQQEEVDDVGKDIEEVVEEARENPSSSQPSRSATQRRRWVSYNTSASFAEDEERKAKHDKNYKNRDTNRLPTDDVRRLMRSIPASPLAQVRWKDRDRQRNRSTPTSSYDNEDNQEGKEEESTTSKGSILDEEIAILKRRQARAARRQQRLDSIDNNIITNDGITTTSIRTPLNLTPQPPQQEQEQQQGSYKNKNAASYRRTSNSFWGNDDSASNAYHYYFGSNDEGTTNSTSGSGRKGSRKGQGGRGGVPWYARPVVSLFPFLKNWGGFM
ncbi:hypothetical protein Ndes2526B_g01684 [Nannochloris sp. 'desiccata']|nr:hypothetical protein KSW81_005825 [Chlorella desiccata (nom. nud.)]KAH7623261.1 hypothetical protein NADE_002453 [Chlorella desiccata (nom. nud.)]